jgi:hypothetical protein
MLLYKIESHTPTILTTALLLRIPVKCGGTSFQKCSRNSFTCKKPQEAVLAVRQARIKYNVISNTEFY